MVKGRQMDKSPCRGGKGFEVWGDREKRGRRDRRRNKRERGREWGRGKERLWNERKGERGGRERGTIGKKGEIVRESQ